MTCSVRWRSFELDPTAPAARERSGAEHLAEKYGMSVEDARARQQQLRDMAAGDGLDMRFDLTRGGNTFDGHRLLQLAAEHGLQTEMKERLMRAHHTEGELVSDHETLVRLAEEVGVPGCVRRCSRATASPPRSARTSETARGFGINAVPTFVVDRRIAVSGAQPPEVLAAFLQRGWDTRSPIEV